MFPFDSPCNIRKSWCSQGDQKGTLGGKYLIECFDDIRLLNKKVNLLIAAVIKILLKSLKRSDSMDWH